MLAALVVLALLNVGSFALFAHDKRRARTGGRRVPESTLVLSGLISGTIGAWAGVRLLRHKTRKPSFLLRLALASVVDAALAAVAVALAA
ncbi:MAG: DUF1294 domain-containing protein [Thermoleophilia bacterium]